jgi:ornithine cyclodeaminase/alanine dehydrogenase-like protein (mu-crystallin family)
MIYKIHPRYLTDLRTGAAGAVCVKYFAAREHTKVAFVGAGVIAKAMARASNHVHTFTQVSYLCICVFMEDANNNRRCMQS